jgi:hypothetical protein
VARAQDDQFCPQPQRHKISGGQQELGQRRRLRARLLKIMNEKTIKYKIAFFIRGKKQTSADSSSGTISSAVVNLF